MVEDIEIDPAAIELPKEEMPSSHTVLIRALVF